MREIKDHIVSGDPAPQLKIEVTDEPGAGGACHWYEITGYDICDNPAVEDPMDCQLNLNKLIILFQNGPIAEAGVNGITQEVLLAIVMDRLRSFQAGPFACYENGEALSYCEMALDCLKARTVDRLERAVEGQTQA